jgi:hypothetical protein
MGRTGDQRRDGIGPLVEEALECPFTNGPDLGIKILKGSLVAEAHLLPHLRNDSDQWLATAHLSIPQSVIASPLQCLVRRGGAELFGKKLLIVVVVADPIPKKGVVFEDSEAR